MLLAVTYLRALVWAICAFLGVSQTPGHTRIVEAIVQATADEHEAALLTVFAKHESDFQENPVPVSNDAHRGWSGGPWQVWGDAKRLPLVGQAKNWLAQYHAGQRTCPEAPLAPLAGGCNRTAARSIARARDAEARRLEAQAELDVALHGVSPSADWDLVLEMAP